MLNYMDARGNYLECKISGRYPEKQKGYQTFRTLRTFSFFFLCGLCDEAESVIW